VPILGRDRFFANAESIVQVANSSFAFRNPPQFMSHWELAARDAHHETEAVLDHYMEHPNTPPFVSDFFIKRFTSSNPSPSYV